MKRTLTQRLLCLALLAALVIGIEMLGPHAKAQISYTPQLRNRLRAPVRLSLGETTADRVVTSLSQQTGIKITLAEPLLHRRLIAQMDGLTGQEALDALTALNDWSWIETAPDAILIRRRRLRSAQDAHAIPALIQAALPVDFRTLAGISRLIDEQPKQQLPAGMADQQSRTMQGVKGKGRLITAGLQAQQRLLDEIDAATLLAHPLKFTQMTSDMRSNILRILVLRALAESSSDVLSGTLPLYALSPGDAVLEVHAGSNYLTVGSHLDIGDYHESDAAFSQPLPGTTQEIH